MRAGRTDGATVRSLTGAVRRNLRGRRGAVLLVATVFVMIVASLVTHLAAAPASSGETGAEGETAEGGMAILPPLIGPLGAIGPSSIACM